jgi:hypothetical protein
MKKLYTLSFILSTLFLGFTSNAQVVISQVYGAGGNSGATLNRDYVELFNRGSVAVDMTGWSIQYNSATGVNAWLFNLMPSGAVIQPGKYYLIAFGPVGANGTAIATPDFDSTAVGFLALSGSNGRVALASFSTAIPAGCATGAGIIDVVGYGTANCYEGAAATAALTSTTAAFRANGGCTDTNNNGADFTSATPAPRNSSTAVNTCVLSVKQNEISGLNMYPNPVKNGNLYITSNSSEAKSVEIYDILGKQVLNAKVSNNTVNVSNLKGGSYIVKINEEGKTASRKLIIE